MCKISDSPVGITVFSLQEFFRPKSFWFFGSFSSWFCFVSACRALLVLSEMVLVLSETVLVLVIERNL
jgi:hypothetical protein